MLEEVSKRRILVDPSTSNNPKLKEAAWEEVRNIVNVTFGLTLEREQVRKKYKREPTLQANSKFGLCYTPCILTLIYG